MFRLINIAIKLKTSHQRVPSRFHEHGKARRCLSQVPSQISSLNGGLNHASVVLHPRLGGVQSTSTLHATFAFAVHAGACFVHVN